MRIAVLGGSFNPLHIGHCMLAETAVKELGYDRVLFVPVFVPPHKMMNNAADAENRLEMVESFCESSEKGEERGRHFFCEPCEIERKGVSYTFDTLVYICEKYKDCIEGKPALILGEESASQFHKWHKAEELASLVDFVIARRHPDRNGVDVEGFSNVPLGGYKNDFEDAEKQFSFSSAFSGSESPDSFKAFFSEKFSYPFTLLQNPVLPVSSTEIRSRIACGKAFRYLVPEQVFYYIKEHKLYGLK